MFHMEKLDMHVSDACNLHCEQCDHFSNYGFKGTHSLETLASWCKSWSHRVQPMSFHILGGETPALLPRLSVASRKILWHVPPNDLDSTAH